MCRPYAQVWIENHQRYWPVAQGRLQIARQIPEKPSLLKSGHDAPLAQSTRPQGSPQNILSRPPPIRSMAPRPSLCARRTAPPTPTCPSRIGQNKAIRDNSREIGRIGFVLHESKKVVSSVD